MQQLRPCPACARHVAVHEVACPFCATTLPPGAARNVALRGRLTRAAVFGAALAAGACGNKTNDAPKPAQGSSDPKELERMLDEPIGRDPTTTTQAAPIDAAADAAAIAAAVDAGVPDAGPDPAAIARREAERKRREAERRRRLEEEEQQKRLEAERLLQQQQQQQQFHNAKPYGAPPARRRLV